jgi:hypothetical protein
MIVHFYLVLNNKSYDEKKGRESNFSKLFLPLKKKVIKLSEETTYLKEQISKFLRKKHSNQELFVSLESS